MTKWLKLVFLAMILVGFTACGDKKSKQVSTKTPAESIVGHWSTSAGDNLYFSAIAADGLGSYILVQPSGRTFRHKYKINKEAPADRSMVIEELYVSGGSSNVKCVFSSDGAHMTTTKEITGMQISSDHNLVDAKIEP